MQENQLYRKIQVYLNSLPCVEDSDFTNLFSGDKPNEINLLLDSNHSVIDVFLSARLIWVHENGEKNGNTSNNSLVLKIKKIEKRRILRPYLQHILTTYDEIEARNKEVRLFMNVDDDQENNGRWRSIPLSHPTSMDTVVMDVDLKNKIKSDLEAFLKAKQYYHRLGRVWKRSYLLYGQCGTGKSTFIVAMAKFLGYDIYDVDLSKVSDDSDLKMILMQITKKSVVVMEDLDRYLAQKSTAVSLSGILNFMDGILSCCGEERLMVFTMNGKDRVDPTVLRPGRIDVHIHFPLCDFNAFKTLASSHLGLRDHKLFPQVEEMFQTGASLSPSEIGEIMISNRGSPSRALKTLITALQSEGEARKASKIRGPRLSDSGSVRVVEECGESGVFCRESGGSRFRDIGKLVSLLRAKSTRKESFDLDFLEKENLRHENWKLGYGKYKGQKPLSSWSIGIRVGQMNEFLFMNVQIQNQQ
ncbi:hypothetical protein Leryth_004046 [Lithospermum erythrorhizon]|nr:hypothetical protein Leryth_004046 [Lithospermum erythrorhizon]